MAAPSRAGSTSSPERGSPLVLEGQRSAAARTLLRRNRCPNAPRGLRLVGPNGLWTLDCKRRHCEVCGPRRARELARVLVLDARIEPPTIALTLTTARTDTSAAAYRHACATLWKRLRREYGRAEYFAAVEFTTGTAPRSGGHRRLHAHHLVKGLDVADVLAIERSCRQVMETAIAAPVVEVAALRSAGAAIGYLGLHHRKPQQKPPVGWRGMVERSSRGYFARPIGELRQQARDELAAEWIAERDRIPLEQAARAVQLQRDRTAAHRTRLIRVHERLGAAVIEPAGERLP